MASTDMAEMIKKAQEAVGSSSSSEESSDQGIQIERQNVETIRGQAKSGR